ncbi:unnamed protein product, partial [Rotaria magnacalcarata]
PPPSLFLAIRPSPQSRHQLITANRSPSPSTVSKFAQVRDIFARAEAAAVAANAHNFHSHLHHQVPTKTHNPNQHIPLINSSSHQVLPIERNRSPKSVTVLNAVQEYQRQHINANHIGQKRFGLIPGGPPAIHNNRPININGNNYIRPRGIGAFISNNTKPLFQNKQTPPAIIPSYVLPSPKQQVQPSKPMSP